MRISPRAYFQYSLLAPIWIPLLLLPFSQLSVVFFLLVLSLAFGGVPYIFFAAGVFLLMRRISSVVTIRWLTLLAPPLFVPVQALFCVAVDSVQESRIVFECEYLDAFARYILIVGYGYVIAINAGYVGFRRLGWIDETREPATVTGGKPRPR